MENFLIIMVDEFGNVDTLTEEEYLYQPSPFDV
jgi:hypothetical protein